MPATPPGSLENSPINIPSIVPSLLPHHPLTSLPRLPLQQQPLLRYPTLYRSQFFPNNIAPNYQTRLPLNLPHIVNGGQGQHPLVTVLPYRPQFSVPVQSGFQQPVEHIPNVSSARQSHYSSQMISSETEEISVMDEDVSKNVGESVESANRPPSVPYYTTSTDSKQLHRPACKPHDTVHNIECNSTPYQSVATNRSKMEIPPLIKVDSQDALTNILNNVHSQQTNGLTKSSLMKAPSKHRERKSMLTNVRLYSSPYYPESREQSRYSRNERWQDVSSETDSDSAVSEDNGVSSHYIYPFQMGFNTVVDCCDYNT